LPLKNPKNQKEVDELDYNMNFLRDVVNDEDYLLGIEIQKGLNSNSNNSVLFGGMKEEINSSTSTLIIMLMIVLKNLQNFKVNFLVLIVKLNIFI
jgi:hypothetical protein